MGVTRAFAIGEEETDVRQSNLELELRLQQFIEMTRSGDPAKLIDATLHARKHLGSQQDTDYGLRAGGLLAYTSFTAIEPYKVRSVPVRDYTQR